MTIIRASEPLPIVRAAIAAALSPLVPLDLDGLPRCYWQLASERSGGRPLIIFQSQDRGGQIAPFIGAAGWSGLFAIKAYGDYSDQADELINSADQAMLEIASPAGYHLTVLESTPLTEAPTGDQRMAGVIYRLALYKA